MSDIKSALDPGKNQLAENMTLASESLLPADAANVAPIRVVLDNGTMPSSLAALIEQWD